MTKLNHYDNLGTARFVTFSCFQKREYFKNIESKMIFLKCLKDFRKNVSIKIYGYVIMPDHIHLVLHPPNGLKLGVLIGQLKGRSSNAIIKIRDDISVRSNGHPAVWEKRCYDHNCRTHEIVVEKNNYCHMNPVKAGIVDNPLDYVWSSYRCYEGYKDVALEIDMIEI